MSVVTKAIKPTDRRLGRIVNHDSRSRNFRALSPAVVGLLEPRTKTWRRGGPYDQGQTPRCVAYTGKGLLNTGPASALVPYATRSRYSVPEFYEGAQLNDEWDGEDYDGTSALGLCRYLASVGRIHEYKWNFGLRDTLLCLSHIGPVGIGVWWWTDMFDTDTSGYLHPRGVREGGHEVQLIGIDVARKRVIGMNSWGVGWGVGGRFCVSWDDLGILLEDDGDSVVISGVTPGA